MKKMKNILLTALLFTCVILFVRFFLGGPEDDWLCQNGERVKHGNPKAEKPTFVCPK